MMNKAQPILKPPEELVRYVKENKCVLFVGSGLSKCAGLPTWEELLDSMLNKLHEEGLDSLHQNELKSLFEAKKFLEIADYCRVKFDKRFYSEILLPQLRGDKVPIPEHHEVIMKSQFAGIVTTNYDKLLERAYMKETNGQEWPKIATHTDIGMLGTLLCESQTFILKAHGDIDQPESLILTAHDYSEKIHTSPAFDAIFSAILLTKAILFVGYSINDPDFRLLLDRQFTIFKGSVPGRYALMSKSKVGEVEREILLRTAGIQVLAYDKHDEVLTFLKELRNQVIRS